MFRRIKRQRFDTSADAIVAAATAIGALMVEQASGLLLKVVYVTGEKLDRLDSNLHSFRDQDAALAHNEVFTELLEELQRCSNLYIVSTSIEVVIVSDRSALAYKQLKDMFLPLAVEYDEFRTECSRFISGLKAIAA